MSILLDTLKGRESKRPPVWFMRQAGRSLPVYQKLREKYSFAELMTNPELAAKITLLPVTNIGVDAAILFSDILVVPQALSMKVNYTDSGPEFENPLYNKQFPANYLHPDLSTFSHIYKAIDIIVKEKSIEIPLIGFCGAPFTVFCYMMQNCKQSDRFADAVKLLYNDRKKALNILEIITETSVAYAKQQILHGVDVFQIFETHAGLIPSDLYIELLLPFVEKITTAVKEKGIPLIFFPKGIGIGLEHIHKNIADFISIDWQTSIYDARKIVDKEIGLQGNFNPQLLCADKNTIEHNLEKYKEFGKYNKDWIFNLGHGILPNSNIDNIRLIVDWVRTTDWQRN